MCPMVEFTKGHCYWVLRIGKEFLYLVTKKEGIINIKRAEHVQR